MDRLMSRDRVDGRNAALRDNATFGSGLVGQAFLLDGVGDFVEVPDDPALNIRAPLSRSV